VLVLDVALPVLDPSRCESVPGVRWQRKKSTVAIPGKTIAFAMGFTAGPAVLAPESRDQDRSSQQRTANLLRSVGSPVSATIVWSAYETLRTSLTWRARAP
jgi:hypothetical protein